MNEVRDQPKWAPKALYAHWKATDEEPEELLEDDRVEYLFTPSV